ncbi:MAG: class II aldolase/adducin family protein [Gemmatimonadales bacterium]
MDRGLGSCCAIYAPPGKVATTLPSGIRRVSILRTRPAGGGNTSIKLSLPGDAGGSVEALLVKGSGTDLRTIGRDGFTRLSLPRLAPLRHAETMSDAEMMRFMAGCMLAEDPAPSVETPLHSLLPHRVIAHTHDVATMSLTNVSDATAERLIGELFEGRIMCVPYTRPGFPWPGP